MRVKTHTYIELTYMVSKFPQHGFLGEINKFNLVHGLLQMWQRVFQFLLSLFLNRGLLVRKKILLYYNVKFGDKKYVW